MPIFATYLLPNNQPQISLGYIKAKNSSEAIKKARRVHRLGSKDDIIASIVDSDDIRIEILRLDEKIRVLGKHRLKLLDLIGE